jgi:hypothetical protein
LRQRLAKAVRNRVVHLDDRVEQRLARLEQIASNEGIALGRRKAPQIAGVVAAAELPGVAHEPGIEIVEPGLGTEQIADQPPAIDVGLDDTGVWCPRIILEPEQFVRQSGGDRLEQVVRGLCHNGIDDAFERAQGR